MFRANSGSARRKRGLVASAFVLAGAMLLPASLAFADTVDVDTPQSDDLSVCPWMDVSKSAEERAELLISNSTQHQKYRWLNEHSANSPREVSFSGVEYPEQVPCTPDVIYANGAEGVHSTPGTTAWPSPITIAASFNTELNEIRAGLQAGEAFDNRNAVILGPGAASGRTPLSGRTPEYFGEDPLLTGLMAAASIRGLQEGNPEKPVVANLKHYVANEQEVDRSASSSNMDERTFRQIYDLPYEIAIKESNPDSIMCSYNQINGVYACENPIMNTSLRDKMGFTGYVMSDFGSVHSTADSLNAGLDQELNRPIWFTPELLDEALENGEITQERIDEAATNVVRSYIRRGLFDHLIPDEKIPNTSTAEHRQVALDLAEQGSVLLKNESVLPLKPGNSVAIIGQVASASPTNGISAESACAASFRGTRTVLDCSNVEDSLSAISAKVQAGGGTVFHDSGEDVNSAAIAAASADVAIVFGYKQMGEFDDIDDIFLDGNGNELIEKVAAAAKQTVVVMHTGTVIEMPWIDDVDAAVTMWYPGEQQGPAIANLLYGDSNFSGKLPMTFPKTLSDTPTNTDEQYPGVFSDGSTVRPESTNEIRQVNYKEGLGVGYRWYESQNIEPQFAFGHGLSYSDFEYTNLEVSSNIASDFSTFVTEVTFDLTNNSDVDGTEVVQTYLTLPESANEPSKRLVAFERVDVAAGETQQVSFTIDSQDSNQPYSIWDVDSDAWVIPEGEYGISIGSASDDLLLRKSINGSDEDQAPQLVVSVDPSESNGTSGWYNSAVEITLSATDALDSNPVIEYRLNESDWQTYDEPVQVAEEGNTKFEARARNSSGIESEIVEWSGRIDTSAPEVSTEFEESDSTVTLEATDSVSGVVELNFAVSDSVETEPAEWQSYEDAISVQSDLPVVWYQAIDEAGNATVGHLDVTELLPVTPTDPETPSPSEGATDEEPTDEPSSPAEKPGDNGGNGDMAVTGFAQTGLITAAVLLLAAGGGIIARRRYLLNK